jgi:8-oxo-dGTP pyrophosphatase MutT (NUDIX family)
MEIYKCDKRCCTIKVYSYKKKLYRHRRPNYLKAGVFIYDPCTNRVLLVQSRGSLWGCPKGTLNIGESPIKGAVREVMEETGIDLSGVTFIDLINIKNRSIYYYLEMKVCDVEIQICNSDEINDANGISWIKLDCLEKFILDGNIVLSHYTKIVFKKFLNKVFQKSEYKKITYKKNKSQVY